MRLQRNQLPDTFSHDVDADRFTNGISYCDPYNLSDDACPNNAISYCEPHNFSDHVSSYDVVSHR